MNGRAALVGMLLAVVVLAWPGRWRVEITEGKRTWGVHGSLTALVGRVRARLVHHRPGGVGAQGLDDDAGYAEVLAVALRAGASTPAARDLAEGLVPQGRVQASSLLAQAMVLADDLGTPLAPAVDVCAHVARDRAAAQRRRHTALSGVRASMWLLTALPVAGPIGLLLIGVDVAQTYAGSALAAGSTVLGALLTGLGWWTSRAIVRRAVRPARWPG